MPKTYFPGANAMHIFGLFAFKNKTDTGAYPIKIFSVNFMIR